MIRTAIVTVSDSTFAGVREDKSGPALEARIAELGWTLSSRHLVPDETAQISALLSELVHGRAVDLIVTTGGTGLAQRDVTPEATRAIANREIPGFGETDAGRGPEIHKICSALPEYCIYRWYCADCEFAWLAARCGRVLRCGSRPDSSRRGFVTR